MYKLLLEILIEHNYFAITRVAAEAYQNRIKLSVLQRIHEKKSFMLITTPFDAANKQLLN